MVSDMLHELTCTDNRSKSTSKYCQIKTLNLNCGEETYILKQLCREHFSNEPDKLFLVQTWVLSTTLQDLNVYNSYSILINKRNECQH